MILHLDQIDTNTLTNHSNVGGNIYLQIGQAYFPEENWYDMVSLLLEQWIPAILSFSKNHTNVCKLTFYDGPCYAVLCRNADDRITVKCLYDQKIVIEETVIDFTVFLKSVVKAGNKFCRLLHLQDRNNDNVAASVQSLKSFTRTVEGVGPYK